MNGRRALATAARGADDFMKDDQKTMHRRRTTAKVRKPLLLFLLGSVTIGAALTVGSPARANYFLGQSHYNRGRPARAAEIWRIHAMKGEVMSQFALGRLYERGEGVEKDLVEGYAWYSLAEQGGHPDARFRRQALARDLTREERLLAAERESTLRKAIEPQLAREIDSYRNRAPQPSPKANRSEPTPSREPPARTQKSLLAAAVNAQSPPPIVTPRTRLTGQFYQTVMSQILAQPMTMATGKMRAYLGQTNPYRRIEKSKAMAVCIDWERSTPTERAGRGWYFYSGLSNADNRYIALGECRRRFARSCECVIADQNDRNALVLPEDFVRRFGK